MLLTDLITTISNTHEYFQRQANQKVNTAMTLRNWFIGCYLLEYEQQGQDRATYGEHLYKEIAAQLLKQRLKGFSIIGMRPRKTRSGRIIESLINL
jgi:hypothetical protein